jgi:hypothetical protein
MLSYTELKEKPKVLLSFTGLTSTEFDELLTVFSAVFRRRQEEKAATKERQRRPGGGRKPILRTDEDRLLFILYHLKLYVIQEVQAFMFGMGQSQANYWIHHLSPVLEEALAELNMLPERQGERMEKTLREGERPVFVQDASERRRNRPKNKEKQKTYYSGKKKTHTVKNHLVVHPESRRVCFLSQTTPGKKHDKRLADESNLLFPPLTLLEQDTGYQGYRPENVIVRQPKKKPRKQELTSSEKFTNRCISSARIIVENVIAGVKRCRIVKDVFRNWKSNFDDLVMLLACGLHNLRVAHRSPIKPFSLVEFYFR